MTDGAPLLPETGRMDGSVHHMPIRIYYEDTDAGGIVYHANYLRYMERGRSNMLRHLGIDHAGAWASASDARSRLGFAVRRCQIDYLVPAVLDDALVVETRLVRLAAAFVDLRQDVTRAGQTLAVGDLRVALVDATGRPRRLPADWRARMEQVLVE